MWCPLLKHDHWVHSIYIINLFNKTKSPNVRPETDNGDLGVVRQRHDKTKTVSIRNILFLYLFILFILQETISLIRAGIIRKSL